MPKPLRKTRPKTFAGYKADAAERLKNAKPGDMVLAGGHRFVKKPNGKVEVRWD
ncbi:MAG: hypothetical protein JW744_05435 [Candidatus Diapherotrites archaeon]|uniref:Uncharacterized protein n=1 Tax=Candidatus Iainarchaeum sp. TaxID=3101447 RepID=A0A938YPG5_9ARCH|nr:hypothetical protein [Candidatus Diapherotrites archaeon]